MLQKAVACCVSVLLMQRQRCRLVARLTKKRTGKRDVLPESPRPFLCSVLQIWDLTATAVGGASAARHHPWRSPTLTQLVLTGTPLYSCRCSKRVPRA
jgi:hypothetical protein